MLQLLFILLLPFPIEDSTEEEPPSSETEICSVREYRCSRDGSCIPKSYLCDGIPDDCPGNEDELEVNCDDHDNEGGDDSEEPNGEHLTSKQLD